MSTATRTPATEVMPGHIRFHIFREGHKPVQVDGTVGTRKCGARCTNSMGPSCSCTCGGHNHGKALWS